VGKSDIRRRGKGVAQFPPNPSFAKKIWHRMGNIPNLRHKRASKGKPAAIGRVWKHGLTPEELLMRIAPAGTAPERMLFGWLVTHGISFTFQEPVLGGRVPGGAIIDFVIYEVEPPLAIRVQSYWHTSGESMLHDEVQAGVLMDLGFSVQDIWEFEVNTVERVNLKMRELLYGFNRRGR